MIIDAHSHPDEFWSTRTATDFSASFASIKKSGMSVSVFCAVGDSKEPKGFWEESFPGVMTQLEKAMRYVQSGQTKLVLKASDIPNPLRPGDPVGAILGIEGVNPLQDDLTRFDEAYRFGVRIITLGHYKASNLTDVMTDPPKHGGLSTLGRQAVQKMDRLGIVIDVAHVSADALRHIAEVTRRPLVDSHTSPCPAEIPGLAAVSVPGARSNSSRKQTGLFVPGRLRIAGEITGVGLSLIGQKKSRK